jgi:cell division protease FtsH
MRTLVYVSAIIIACFMYVSLDDGTFIKYNELTTSIQQDAIKSATINIKTHNVTFKDAMKTYKYDYVSDENLKAIYDSLIAHNVAITTETWSLKQFIQDNMVYIVLVMLLIVLYKKMAKGLSNDPNNKYTMSTAQLISPDNIDVRIGDVSGSSENLNDITDVIEYLKTPDKYIKIGAKLPRGILLYGPPGVGKTMVCKAIAKESNVPFLFVSGSDFDEILVGSGSARLKDMFAYAKSLSPCIIFIDEIDSLGKKRNKNSFSSSGDQSLNQLLTQMDSFNTSDNVIVIGATNRIDMLDEALLRPGRFDRVIPLSLPNVDTRKQIFTTHLKKVSTELTLDTEKLAKLTIGMSGADIANIVNEAALYAAKNDQLQVKQTDLTHAMDKIMMGNVSNRPLTKENVYMTAIHEAGHAVVGFNVKDNDTIHKISVIPRNTSLGVTVFLPKDEDGSSSIQKLKGKVATLLAGYAAEEMIFGPHKVSTGASDDIKRAKIICTNMVKSWGMGEQKMWALCDDESESSKTTNDNNVAMILQECYQMANDTLFNNKEKLLLLASTLVELETMDDQQINDILKIGE